MTRSRRGFESDAVQLRLAAPQQTTPWASRTSRCPINGTTDKTETGFTEFVGSTWFGEEHPARHTPGLMIETDSTLDTR
jgi:hypothetical protein